MRFTKTRPLKEVEYIGQGIAYLRNYQPVYEIQFLFRPSGKIKFGSHLPPGERAWLIAELNKAKDISGI